MKKAGLYFIVLLILLPPIQSNANSAALATTVTVLNYSGNFCKIPFFKATPVSAVVTTVVGFGLSYTAKKIQNYIEENSEYDNQEWGSATPDVEGLFDNIDELEELEDMKDDDYAVNVKSVNDAMKDIHKCRKLENKIKADRDFIEYEPEECLSNIDGGIEIQLNWWLDSIDAAKKYVCLDDDLYDSEINDLKSCLEDVEDAITEKFKEVYERCLHPSESDFDTIWERLNIGKGKYNEMVGEKAPKLKQFLNKFQSGRTYKTTPGASSQGGVR